MISDARSAAYEAAHRVVGLYGDPGRSWSVLVQLRLAVPIDPLGIQGRLDTLATRYPLLGPPPVATQFADAHLIPEAERLINTGYTAESSLVRVSMNASADTLLVAGHHGCVDGLGLVGLAAEALGSPLRSTARGVGGTPAATGFLRSAMARISEAVARPPVRFASDPAFARRHDDPGDTGDWLVQDHVTGAAGTAHLVVATRRALTRWNAECGVSPRRSVSFAIGASRRTSAQDLEPNRNTAFLRLRDVPELDLDQARNLLRTAVPEPDFPSTRGGGLGPVVTRLLASRLGSTAVLSHLGQLSGDLRIRDAYLFPVAGGPQAVAVGMAGAGEGTGVSVRARSRDFTRAHANRLLGLITEEVRALTAPVD